MVQLNLATAVAHSRTIVDHLTRQSLRWQRMADNTVFPRMADMLGVNWEALVDEDHEAALAVERRREPEPFALPHEYVGIAAEVEVA